MSAMTAARQNHTATLLPNGKVLVVGGFNRTDSQGPLSHVKVWYPATERWTEASELAASRGGHTATLLSSGMVLVAGGEGNSGVLNLSSVELYKSSHGHVDNIQPNDRLTPVSHGNPTLNGKVLVAGGLGSSDPKDALSSVKCLNPATGVWMAVKPMKTARRQHAAILLPNGKVLVAGGGAAVISSMIFPA